MGMACFLVLIFTSLSGPAAAQSWRSHSGGISTLQRTAENVQHFFAPRGSTRYNGMSAARYLNPARLPGETIEMTHRRTIVIVRHRDREMRHLRYKYGGNNAPSYYYITGGYPTYEGPKPDTNRGGCISCSGN
jgi:hypothetical protein